VFDDFEAFLESGKLGDNLGTMRLRQGQPLDSFPGPAKTSSA
jgi:hypothetical protein